jgi:hypothetical protein
VIKIVVATVFALLDNVFATLITMELIVQTASTLITQSVDICAHLIKELASWSKQYKTTDILVVLASLDILE